MGEDARMATIHVDGKTYEVDGADNLLQACLSLGLDVPYFCWHPALGSVGACRQCAVKQYNDANDTRGRLVMSCMTPAADNTYISIDDEEATAFRKSVIEWLMTNHPHDCPVCAEGGHCHLQDMTVMTGHNTRRYRFNKRTHNNQDLGPFVKHEMNRCIACYRCVRYYKDYADGQDLGVYGAHDNVYFGRVNDGTLESEFSGNLTEVCPTGVFTDKTHGDHYARKWDMQFAPSICQHCSVGCNISPGERYGEIRRVENRFNGAVNHYFLCDRGRFGYGFVNREDRPRQPWVRHENERETLSVESALDKAAGALRQAKRVIGIGSPRASLETNYALIELVGVNNYSLGVSTQERQMLQSAIAALRDNGLYTPSLREMENADTVLVLGEDVTQTAPRMALAIRQAVKTKARQLAAERKVPEWNAEPLKNIAQGQRSPLYVAAVDMTRLDDVASDCYRAASADIARLGFAVAHCLDAAAPAVSGLSAEQQALAAIVAADLVAAVTPLIVTGTSLQDPAVVQAALNVALALKKSGKPVALAVAVPEANSLGVALIDGMSVEDALHAVEEGAADALVIVENDLYRRAPATLVDAALRKASTVVVIDHQATPTVSQATMLLPATSFVEGDGTLVSMEGRAQRYFQVFDATYYDQSSCIHEGWRWLHALHTTRQGKPIDWTHLDNVTAACAEAIPPLARIVDAAPDAKFRIKGLKVAREPRRYSGRTAMRANISVHEPRAPQDEDTALTFSMEGYVGPQEPAALTAFAWAPGWNSPQAWNKFQDEVGGHSRAGDAGVRLLDSAAEGVYGTVIPAAHSANGKWLVQPLFHIFGSEELSSAAPVMAARIPEAHVVLSEQDASHLGIAAGDHVTLANEDLSLCVAARLSATLPAGVLGMPAGLASLPVGWAGCSITVSKGAN